MTHADLSIDPGFTRYVVPHRDTAATATQASRPVVHVVDVDDDVHRMLAAELETLGIALRVHSHLLGFLNAPRAAGPGCLVVDAQALSAAGFESAPCPMVVTARRADVGMAVRAMRAGAIDVIESPWCARKLAAAVRAALDIDRRRQAAASRHADVHAAYATLTRRERQVMALVTAGKLNKQVGGDLGISEITVKAHRGAMMRKMRARSLADLVRMADTIRDDLDSGVRSGS